MIPYSWSTNGKECDTLLSLVYSCCFTSAVMVELEDMFRPEEKGKAYGIYTFFTLGVKHSIMLGDHAVVIDLFLSWTATL